MNPALRAILLSQPQRPPSEILSLFSAGEQGGIWLPNFQRSMFQDAAMSNPAVVGMPVVKMLDLSGRGNTITFSNVTLQKDGNGHNYLLANGTNSNGATASINFSGTDKMTVWTSVRKLSDAATGMVVELTADSNANNGAFYVIAPSGAAANFGFATKGTGSGASGSYATYTSPITAVLDMSCDNAGTGTGASAQLRPRINGVAQLNVSATTDANFANAPLYFFERGGATLPFNGWWYGAIVRGAASSDQQLAMGRAYINKLTSAY